MNRCIVNLVTNDHYRKGQQRLVNSLSGIDVVTFTSESQVGAPPHSENPYAFKIYAIKEAIRRGYQQVLWLDASVYAVGDINKVFDWITQHGVFMEEAGHWAGQWCNDEALKYFDITREEAMNMPMFSAGFVGFDFTTYIGQRFFGLWDKAMKDGAFKGLWENHRHDMAAGSVIANKMGLNKIYSHGGQFFAYVGAGYGPPLPSVVCCLQGMP